MQHALLVESAESPGIAKLVGIGSGENRRFRGDGHGESPVQAHLVCGLTGRGRETHHALHVQAAHLRGVVKVADSLLDVRWVHVRQVVLRDLLQGVEYLRHRRVGLAVLSEYVAHGRDRSGHGLEAVGCAVGLKLLHLGAEVWKVGELFQSLALLLGHFLKVGSSACAEHAASRHLVEHLASLASADASHLRQVGVFTVKFVGQGADQIHGAVFAETYRTAGRVLHISGSFGYALAHDGCRSAQAVNLVGKLWVDLGYVGHQFGHVV